MGHKQKQSQNGYKSNVIPHGFILTNEKGGGGYLGNYFNGSIGETANFIFI